MNSSPNILFLPSWYPTREGDLNGIFNLEMAKELSGKYNIFVLHLAFDSAVQHIEVSRKVNDGGFFEHVVRIPYKNFLWNQWHYFKLFFSELKNMESAHGKMQMVHVSVAWKMGLFALLLKKLRGIKYIVTEHFTGYLPADASLTGYKKSFSLRILKNAFAVSVLGEGLKEALNARKIHSTVIPNFIHPEILNFSEPIEKPTATSFIHISSFNLRQKQTDTIVFAFNDLKKKYPEITLTLVVPKQKWQEFISKHTGMDVSGIAIQKPGLSRSEYCRLLAAKHCAISYSAFETFSLTTAEALCLGIPVIYTKCGGPEYYVEPDQGICAEKDNPESLFDAMESIIHGNFDSVAIRRKSRLKFNSETTLMKYETLYKEAMK